MDANAKIFDAILNIAADDAMQREMAKLPSLEELNKMYRPSEALDKRVHSIIRRDARAARRRKIMRTFAKAAAILCVFIVVCFGVLMTVEASRNYILNMLIDVRDDHVLFEFGQGNASGTIDSMLISEALPEGFVLVDSHILTDSSLYFFINEFDDEILVFHGTSMDTIGIDNEQREFTVIEIDGQEVFLFAALYDHARNGIMWVQGESVVYVSTNLPLDDLTKIVKAIMAK